MALESRYDFADFSGSEIATKPQSRCWLGLLSNVKALLGKDSSPSSVKWWLGRFSFMLTVAQRPLSVPCHMGLALWQLTTWQLASLEKARENQRGSKKTFALLELGSHSGVWGRMNIYIYIAESLHCLPESITTLLISYTPVQSKKFFKKEKKKVTFCAAFLPRDTYQTLLVDCPLTHLDLSLG